MTSGQRATTGSPVGSISTTMLMIVTVLLLVVVAGVAIAAWVITRQPPEQPLPVPSVSQA